MSILFPVFIQVALTIFLITRLGLMRVGALKRREVKLSDIAESKDAWPLAIRRVADNYNNQSELPILFYAATAMILSTGLGNDKLLVGLAWVFVTLRLVHSFIHTTNNYVPHRFYVFLVGIIVLTALWIVFAMKVFG